MLRLAYNALLHLALPLLPLRLWWRGRKEPGYRAHVGERFGAYARRPDRPVIWIHAVSVGETRAAQPLVEALARRFPDHTLLLTTMTATGRATAESLYGDRATIAFLPYDYPWAVRHFVAHFQPRLGVIMETEIWPNLVRAGRQAGVPIVLANARLSPKSARGYGRVAALTREALADLAAIGAQSDADAQRLRELGAHSVEVTGNLKFDISPPSDMRDRAKALRGLWGKRCVFLAASTREGEEELLLDALERNAIGGLLTVIVPRHPQRFDEVAALLARRGAFMHAAQREYSRSARLRFRAGRHDGRDVRLLRSSRYRLDRRKPLAVWRAESHRGVRHGHARDHRALDLQLRPGDRAGDRGRCRGADSECGRHDCGSRAPRR